MLRASKNPASPCPARNRSTSSSSSATASSGSFTEIVYELRRELVLRCLVNSPRSRLLAMSLRAVLAMPTGADPLPRVDAAPEGMFGKLLG